MLGLATRYRKSIERAPFSSALDKDELVYPAGINLAKAQVSFGSPDSGSSSQNPCDSAQIDIKVSSLSLI